MELVYKFDIIRIGCSAGVVVEGRWWGNKPGLLNILGGGVKPKAV